ncbi:hypothetical protein ABBQ38_006587 [Trebouxia sp. C0009 RCD-2024]
MLLSPLASDSAGTGIWHEEAGFPAGDTVSVSTKQPDQPGTQPGPSARSAQAASQPHPALSNHLSRTRPARPTNVQQVTDTEAKREREQQRWLRPVMAWNQRSASNPADLVFTNKLHNALQSLTVMRSV